MGTHLSLAVVALLGCLTLSEGTMAARIGIDPKPPSVGDTVTLSAGPNMKLQIEVTPGGIYTVTTDANGQATFVVPDAAATMIVSDPSGAWTSNSTSVN